MVVRHGAFGEMVPHLWRAASREGGQLVTTPSCSPRMGTICAPSALGWLGSGCWTVRGKQNENDASSVTQNKHINEPRCHGNVLMAESHLSDASCKHQWPAAPEINILMVFGTLRVLTLTGKLQPFKKWFSFWSKLLIPGQQKSKDTRSSLTLLSGFFSLGQKNWYKWSESI